MDNLSSLNLIIGFVSPILIATINRPTFSSRLKVLVTVLFSVTAGFLTALFTDQFNTTDITQAILITLVTSIVSYQGIFKPTEIAPKIEAATSPTPKVPYVADQVG